MTTLRIYLLLLIMATLLTACTQQIYVPEVAIGKKPRNVILMIGDGMGVPHITSHYYVNKKFSFELFKEVGLVKTHAGDAVVTDSGAGGTAMATGQKAKYNSVGVNTDGEPIPNIAEQLKEMGYYTGIVTTASILDATPASFYAHQLNRYWQDSVSKDLLASEVDFLVGGGQEYFDNTMENSPYSYQDFKESGFKVHSFQRSQIQNVSMDRNKKFMYFNGIESALLYDLGFTHLRKASEKAIKYLEDRESGFFLVIEGAQIDWASHARKQDELDIRMKAFDDVVNSIFSYVSQDEETLLLVTADHSTGGLAILEGSTFSKLRTSFSTNGHTASMVPIFAYGPGAELFNGIMDNTDIYKKIAKLLNVPKKEEASK